MGRASKVECTKYSRKDMIVGEKISEEEKRNILCLEYRTGEKKLW